MNKEGNSKISALEVARNLNERLNYQPLFENMCPRSSPGTPLSSWEGAQNGQERAAEIEPTQTSRSLIAGRAQASQSWGFNFHFHWFTPNDLFNFSLCFTVTVRDVFKHRANIFNLEQRTMKILYGQPIALFNRNSVQ